MPEQTPKKKTPLGTVIVAVVMAAFAAGVYMIACSHGKGRAKDDFANAYTCPPDRIEMRERLDIKGSMFVDHAPPPPEVASDPSRLAIWKKKEAERDSDADSGGNYGVYYWQVRGCGHEDLYECSNKPRCSKVKKYPAGISSAW